MFGCRVLFVGCCCLLLVARWCLFVGCVCSWLLVCGGCVARCVLSSRCFCLLLMFVVCCSLFVVCCACFVDVCCVRLLLVVY